MGYKQIKYTQFQPSNSKRNTKSKTQNVWNFWLSDEQTKKQTDQQKKNNKQEEKLGLLHKLSFHSEINILENILKEILNRL